MIGLLAAAFYQVVGIHSVGQHYDFYVKTGVAQYIQPAQRCRLPRRIAVITDIHVSDVIFYQFGLTERKRRPHAGDGGIKPRLVQHHHVHITFGYYNIIDIFALFFTLYKV